MNHEKQNNQNFRFHLYCGNELQDMTNNENEAQDYVDECNSHKREDCPDYRYEDTQA